MEPMNDADREIIKELEAMVAKQHDPDGYYTIEEWSRKANINERTLREHFRMAKRLGRLNVTRVKREALDGVHRLVPVYRIVPADEAASLQGPSA